MGAFEHPLHHVGGQFLQHVHRIVHKEVLHDGGQLPVRDRHDDDLLGLGRQIGEYLRRQLLWQGTEGHCGLLLGQRLDKLGDVHLVLLRQRGAEGTVVPALRQFTQRLKLVFFHWIFLLSHSWQQGSHQTGKPRQGLRTQSPAALRGDRHLRGMTPIISEEISGRSSQPGPANGYHCPFSYFGRLCPPDVPPFSVKSGGTKIAPLPISIARFPHKGKPFYALTPTRASPGRRTGAPIRPPVRSRPRCPSAPRPRRSPPGRCPPARCRRPRPGWRA